MDPSETPPPSFWRFARFPYNLWGLVRVGSGPVVVWNATKTCNLECVHCYADAETRRFTGELTTAEAEAMIRDLASIKVPALLISGGEPLVRPDVLDLAEFAMSLGVRVTFSTNGTLIDQKKAERIAKIGVTYVGISIDGGEDMPLGGGDRVRVETSEHAARFLRLGPPGDFYLRVGRRLNWLPE